jgi:hypothetical protein
LQLPPCTDYNGGQALFQDPYRMHRDIMADSATAYLDVIFGTPGKQ